MELVQELKTILSQYQNKSVKKNNHKYTLSCCDTSAGELAALLQALAEEYGISLPILIRKLDRLSGDVKLLDRLMATNDEKLQWTPAEDQLLGSSQEQLLVRWKGKESVELRKKYLLQKKNRKK